MRRHRHWKRRVKRRRNHVAQCSYCGKFMAWPSWPAYPYDVHYACLQAEERRIHYGLA